ncbi:hypothetical protein CTEN210_08329 [Chaetoceros tenuissimus]|uniref:D-glutamate cyclase-like C-terminal domain-containing protein n=1 Tax=Chaetoceros tenuissimus TaxID=426638 RepID=A0AAD3CTU9_9STRA|nr:hypothetical protein CTEN210_08329 [Chaetoceros tenuissimus]
MRTAPYIVALILSKILLATASFLSFTQKGNSKKASNQKPQSQYLKKIPLAMTTNNASLQISPKVEQQISNIEALIGTDAGGRGMKALIVPHDLHRAAKVFCSLPPKSAVLVLSGFPCCVDQTPPTETDGPPGAISLCRTALGLGHEVILETDECNEAVFRAAAECLPDIKFEIFPDEKKMTKADEERMKSLVENRCDLIISCERAGPAKDGICYTMRGIDMNAKGLIAPIHKIVEMSREIRPNVKYIAIGDGGNEMGMGKVIEAIRSSDIIQNGDKIGAVTVSDYLIAASVSNWGGYALSGAVCAIMNEKDESDEDWLSKLLPTEADEVELLDRCVKLGCRDGVSGLVEATVDGMPLETSMECLRNIRSAIEK